MKSFWKKRNENKVFSNYIYLLLIQGANFILPLIVLPYLVITLESEKYGLVMIAQSLAVFLSIIVDFGFNISATREVAILKEDKVKLSQYFSNIYFIKFCLILISLLLLFLLTCYVEKFQTEPLVYFYSFGLVIGQAIFPTWFFQGIEKMRTITLINVIAKIFFTISIFFFVVKPSDYESVPLLNGLGLIISGLFGFVFSLRYVNFVLPKIKDVAIITKESFNLFTSNFAVSLYTSSNTLILGFFGGDIIAGVYASMEKLVIATKSIFIPLYQAIFPFISTKKKPEIFNFIKKISFPIFTVGLTITIVIFFWGKQLLDFIYNDELISSYSNVFKILGLIAILSPLNMLLVTLFYPAIKAYKTRMKILVSTGIIHVIIALILVQFYGIYGVAISVSITELLILIFAYQSYRKINR